MKLSRYVTYAAAILHCILGFLAAMQNCALRDFGWAFTLMAVLSLASVVLTSFTGGFLQMIPSLLIILVPGFLVRVLASLVLFMTLGTMAGVGFLVYLFELFSWVFIFI